jgi:DNA-directed RNA polymerase subunit beta'
MNNQEPKVSGEAFKALLSGLDPDKKIAEITEEIKTAKSISKKDELIKRLKYVSGLKGSGLTAENAYILNNIPVLPPTMRPTAIMGNQAKFADITSIYKDHMLVNKPLGENKDLLENSELIKERTDAYNGVKAIMGLGEAISPNSKGRGARGLLAQISGSGGPKTGLFHSTLLSKKQDFSGRATISANPDLGFNEAAVPIDMLWTLYKFHILRDLAKQGLDYVTSEKAWSDRNTVATSSFNKVIKNIPIILNRAPTLMKSNIIAMMPVPVEGSTIGINLLHLRYFAGDFDGDALSIFCPMSPEAVKEAKDKLLPQHQMHDYRLGLGNSLIGPQHESILGSFHLTNPASGTPTKFKTESDALKAFHAGHLEVNSPVEITG